MLLWRSETTSFGRGEAHACQASQLAAASEERDHVGLDIDP